MEELYDFPNQYSSPSRGHYDASFNVGDFGRHEPPFESRATDPVAGHPSGARDISAFTMRSQPLRHLKPFSEVAVSRTARIFQSKPGDTPACRGSHWHKGSSTSCEGKRSSNDLETAVPASGLKPPQPSCRRGVPGLSKPRRSLSQRRTSRDRK